ncbi:MAG: acyl-CoA carboxylase subunit beta [Schleiferiaceae bacterium]|jgi:3-methylcrotonyl-CoA carboxylase beta subunit|nr:acyl-CoA carboxylase subunit beta [Schleiferiaceae bacterium]MDP4617086.1 acyl-CoA carboxylase subunit beta [Schleiferiaceae bacterium]MDP4759070.1 acyl-CoA carboxylase subunit beta [Schleiferiaceae bacterium]MDP4766869.1 acyl-CoA carboxylase subunit beta [Schleiferiaceae bacterium]MDP4958869.1 acyl-CoA carboxylase subunit beta [Schleiferiaceae bacterium]
MDLTYNKNEDALKLLLSEVKRREAILAKGGGEAKLQKQRDQGKLTARERVAALVDAKKPCLELGIFAGDGMYEEYGGCPAGGVVVVLAYVKGTQCIIVANDATVKAGAWFPITGKKNLRAQQIALENHTPIIYLVDSAGVFLPLQDEIFPDREHFGRIFRNNAVMSSLGIPQISAIMGSCVAGGAYLPIMSDESLIVKGSGSIFLAGSYLVKAAIGESVDNETLGGADTHCDISGVTDYKCEDDQEAITTIRGLVDKMGAFPKAGFDRTTPLDPEHATTDIYGFVPRDGKPFESLRIIECIIDKESWQPYKETYGQTILCGYARIDGWAVGIVANNRAIVKNAKGEMQFGGVIYSDSADKAARFIANCNQKRIPLVFLQDVTGFMVGSKSEHGGIIKDGAKMVNAVANSVVPKFTVIVGNSFGAGNYAMNGTAYDPRLIVAWPNAKLAVMGGQQAAKVLLQIEKSRLKGSGKELTPAELDNLQKDIETRYERQTSPYYAASRLWVDAIIDPAKTREWLSYGIEMSNNNPEMRRYNPGVIQT